MNETNTGEALQCAHANLNYIPAEEEKWLQLKVNGPLEHKGVTPTLNSMEPLAVTVKPIWVSGSALPDYTDSFRAGLLIPLSLTRLIKMDL